MLSLSLLGKKSFVFFVVSMNHIRDFATSPEEVSDILLAKRGDYNEFLTVIRSRTHKPSISIESSREHLLTDFGIEYW